MEDQHIKNILKELRQIAVLGNKENTMTAIREASRAVGGNAKLAKYLGVDVSTPGKWTGGGISSFKGMIKKIDKVLTPSEREEQVFTDAQLRAIAETGVASAEALTFLIHMEEAAGFDLSQDLYQRLLEEFQQHNTG